MSEETNHAHHDDAPRLPYKRQVRNYILDWRYQMRYTATIVAVSALLTGVLGFLIMNKAHEASRVVAVRALDPTDQLAQELVKQFADNDRAMVFMLVAFGVLFCVLVAAFSIVLTHKVAGPLYKVTLHFDRIRDGRLGTIHNLRRGDQLVEFFEHFKRAHDALRKQVEDDIGLLDRAIATVGDGTVAAAMKDAKARKEASLK